MTEPTSPTPTLKLVPMEPTEAMIEAGKDERMECFKDMNLSVGNALSRIYAAMSAAAPTATPKEARGLEEVLQQAKEALEESHVDVVNTLNNYIDHPANARRCALIHAQLDRHHKATLAVGDALAALAATPSSAPGTVVPTIKGVHIAGGYVIVTPAGWGNDKAYAVKDAILAHFTVNPHFTPRPPAPLVAEDPQ